MKNWKIVFFNHRIRMTVYLQIYIKILKWWIMNKIVLSTGLQPPLCKSAWTWYENKLTQCYRWSSGMDKELLPTLNMGCNYLSMLWLKLIYISKNGLSCLLYYCPYRKTANTIYIYMYIYIYIYITYAPEHHGKFNFINYISQGNRNVAEMWSRK